MNFCRKCGVRRASLRKKPLANPTLLSVKKYFKSYKSFSKSEKYFENKAVGEMLQPALLIGKSRLRIRHYYP
jgi:hypothetical protein